MCVCVCVCVCARVGVRARVCVDADFSDIFRSFLGPSLCSSYNNFENKGQKCIKNVHVICKVLYLQTSLQFSDLGQRVERQYLDILTEMNTMQFKSVVE